MLRNFDDALGFEPTRREANLAAWSPSPSASSWSPVAAVRMMGAAFCEGLAAHRKYEALRSKGIPHDGALRQALAIGPPLSWVTRDKRSVSDKKHVRCARPAYVGH